MPFGRSAGIGSGELSSSTGISATPCVAVGGLKSRYVNQSTAQPSTPKMTTPAMLSWNALMNQSTSLTITSIRLPATLESDAVHRRSQAFTGVHSRAQPRTAAHSRSQPSATLERRKPTRARSSWRGEGDGEKLLPQYDRQRRLTAKKYVQAQSIANKELLQESDMDVRRKKMDALGEIADDPVRCHEYLMKSSLIAMVREANAMS